jgi:outer membrane receptor protein involved in Fe transport
VTGSLVNRAGFSSPTPVAVATTDVLTRGQPSSIPDALNQLPNFQGSESNNQDRNSNSGRVRTGNYLNLRSLGTQRVLVLQDGERLPPSGNAGGTDVNLVPQMLVKRVEIVTGGASAAYGSDAVSGVVNFILDKNFEGVSATAQGGISSRSDDKSYRFGVAGGTSLMGDRLHLEGSAEHYHSDGIDNRGTRPGMNQLYAISGTGTAANPFVFIQNVHYSQVAPGGYIATGPLAGKQFLPDGTVGPFAAGPAAGVAGLSFGGQGVTYPLDQTLSASETTDQIFGRADYDFSSHLNGYIQFSYDTASNADASISSSRSTSTTPTTIFSGNAFLPASVQASLGASPSFNVFRLFTDWPAYAVKQDTSAFILHSGLSGDFGKTWKWKLNYAYGDTRFTSQALDVNTQRYYAAVDAVRDASGNIVCRVSVTNPSLLPGCVPVNIMGLGGASTAGINYVMQQATWSVTNVMHDISGTVSGEPFSTWAGPVSVAAGAEYRHQTLNQVSNSNPAVPVDYTGIRGVPTGSGAFFGTVVPLAHGQYGITEGFAETVIPLAKDLPLAKSLELNGAFRVTNYSTSGQVQTWKFGATYEPIEDLRFRGTVSRDIRAPTLSELFSGATVRAQPFADPLTGVNAFYSEVNSGNSKLQPEIGQTYTVGVILQPTKIPGLHVSADYYDITIRGAIASQFSGAQVLALCAASGYTSPVCTQVNRPLGPTNTSPGNFPTSVSIFQTNVSSIKTRGIDFELQYHHALGDGQLGVRGQATHLISYTTQGSSTAAVVEYAGTADVSDQGGIPFPLPKWRGNLAFDYTRGPLSLTIAERVIGGFDRSHLLVYAKNGVGSVGYTDLTVSYDVKGWRDSKTQLFLTVNNAFDTTYPIVPISSVPGLALPTFRSVYDIVGRYFTAGVRMRF